MTRNTEWVVTYTCDACGATTEDASGWGEFYYKNADHYDALLHTRTEHFCKFECGVALLRKHNPAVYETVTMAATDGPRVEPGLGAGAE